MSRAPDGAVQGVIFDFGRVICDFDIGRFLAKAVQASSLGPEELRAVMQRSMPLAARYETGLLSSDEFFGEISRAASLRMSREEFTRAYTDIFTPKPETFALVRRLKGNYRLGLLSNTSDLHYRYGIRTVEIFPLFDAVTLSFEVRAMKPAPEIYRDMLAKLALPADSCVYIDDIAEYAAAARSLGLRGVHYTTHENLLRDLAEAGLEIPSH